MTGGLKLPFYAKATIIFIGVIAFFAILYIAKSILIPIVFATIIAIVLSPVVGFFERLRINRVVAITIALLLTFLIIFALGSLLISQAVKFSESVPVIIDKFSLIINQLITEASSYFDLDSQRIHAWLKTTQSEVINMSTAAIGQSLVIAGSILVVLFLIPVYVFLILFYQPLLLEFIWRLFGNDKQSQVKEIVIQIKTLIQRYLIGLLIEAVIIAILDTTALLILGIEYAVILGIIGALLNIIPYIGGLIAVALPMIVALVTKSTPMYALYVLAVYYFIQLIDNNYIVPIIVSSKVKINALFSIIVVIAGNALWGVPGMFLSIPVLAIVKLICDQFESLKPFGFLFGDTMPPLLKMNSIIKKIKIKSK